MEESTAAVLGQITRPEISPTQAGTPTAQIVHGYARRDDHPGCFGDITAARRIVCEMRR